MPKSFRPFDQKCLCGGIISAAYWRVGDMEVVNRKRKLVEKGHWVLLCNTCEYIGKEF